MYIEVSIQHAVRKPALDHAAIEYQVGLTSYTEMTGRITVELELDMEQPILNKPQVCDSVDRRRIH